MAYKAKKTEHSGSKKGGGAYYGIKRDAKRESTRIRRRHTQRLVQAPPADDLASRAKPSPQSKNRHADVDDILDGRR